MKKKIYARIISAFIITLMVAATAVTAFATGDVTVEVIPDETQSSAGTGAPAGGDNHYNGNSSSTGKVPTGEVPEAVGDILNGEDHASKLFGTDKFKPSDVDTSWTQPIVDALSWIASVACTFFGVFTLLKCVFDPLIIIWSGLGKGLYHLHLSFFYGDLAAALSGAPLPEGRVAETVAEMPTTKPGKLMYWFKDTVFIGVVGGAILIGVATGLLPELINMGVNALINLVIWGMSWIKGL